MWVEIFILHEGDILNERYNGKIIKKNQDLIPFT